MLEFRKLPLSCRREETAEFTDIRGKNLLRILRAIVKADKAETIDKERMAEILAYFSQRKYIHVWEVEAVLRGTGYEIQKEDTRLVLWKNTRGSNFAGQVSRSAKKGNKEALSPEAGDFLARPGIKEYCYMWGDEVFPISCTQNRYSVLEKACLTSDYTGLYQYVKRNKDFSFAERACWAMYTDNGVEAKRADAILFLLSPECRRKPKWFRLSPGIRE